MGLKKLMETRKSVRKYSKKKPDWRDIIECVDVSRHAPMAGGHFTLKFILVSDPKKIQQLAEASQQNFVADAHWVVVACSDPTKTTRSFEDRAHNYVRQQAGAAIQNFLLGLHSKKLSTCWVGHFVDDQIKEILKIPEKVQVEAIFPIGYENKIKGKKTVMRNRTILDSILRFEDYKSKKMFKGKSMYI